MIPVDLLNYQLIRLIGSGGMGEVYLARNKNIDQLVAVKVLHPKYANNPMVRARFKQEAVMLNSLNHPNIVKFLNFVENEYGVFLIMEYVEGCTLEEYINKRNGLIVEAKAYPMFHEILDAFSYAHRHGIIHRDIKPSNIILDKEGHIKVMDFGIAQILSEANNEGGVSMGTPAYMSPEQVYGKALSQRSDVYSLGVLFHQMLTGRAPYDSTTMSEMEIKKLVVNEKLPRMKNYYPYISEGLQNVVDKATSKEPANRYATCDEMLKAVKAILAPEKKSKAPVYIGAAVAAVLILAGFVAWNHFRTKVSYYKDYAEFFGVPEGIGSLSSNEMSHREMSYRIESSKGKVRRVTLVNAKGKTVDHRDTEHRNSRFADVHYFYSDDGQLDYKKVYDPYGKQLYKIDYDENMKVAMFKHDDEHGTAKRLHSNTTQLFNVDESDRSSITRYLLTYDDKGLLQKMEYASGEDNAVVGDAENIYGQAYTYDDKGRITEIRFLGQDGKVRGNHLGLAIKQYAYDDNDDWTQVKYLSADGHPSHDGNNCPLVKLEYDEWGNRIAEKYYTIDGKPSYRTDVSACGFAYEVDDEGNEVKRMLIDGQGKVMTGNNAYSQIRFSYNDDGFNTMMEFLDKDGNRTNINTDDGETYSIVKFTVDEKGLVLSSAYYDTKEQPKELTNGMHKMTCEYDSVGDVLKVAFFDKKLEPAQNNGFNCSTAYTYDSLYRCTSISFYDKEGKMTYNSEGIAKCVYTYDKMGNVVKYENLDKDGKSLVNCQSGQAVQEVTYDALGNMLSIRNLNRSLQPCMTTYGYSSKEYAYDEKTNFTKEVKYLNASGGVIKIERYTFDDNGNKTSEWEVNAAGVLQGAVEHNEYDSNNRITKRYYTNIAGTKINKSGNSYCEENMKYDERGNVTEHTYFSTSGQPAVDELRTHHRIHKYDERNNVIYEKNLGIDGKPLHGYGVNPEGKVEYNEFGDIIALECYDGYGNPTLSSDGFFRMERTFNENHLLASECYKDTKGHLVTSKSNEYAKVTYAYDDKRNKTEEKYFNSNGTLTHTVKSAYNEQNSLTEACIYNAAGKLDDSKVGFSKLGISYDTDGVTPTKKTYYRAGRALAWQYYNRKTGDWGPLNF